MNVPNLLQKLALLGSATIIGSIGVPFNAQAALLGYKIYDDTPEFFGAQVFLDATASSLAQLNVNGTNWAFKVTEGTGVINYPPGQQPGANVTISDIVHKIAPHGEPQNNWNVQFSLARFLAAAVVTGDPHEPTLHADQGVFFYNQYLIPPDAPPGTQWALSATLTHVPEPLTILGTGVVLGALPVLKKKYAKSNKKKDENA